MEWSRERGQVIAILLAAQAQYNLTFSGYPYGTNNGRSQYLVKILNLCNQLIREILSRLASRQHKPRKEHTQRKQWQEQAQTIYH
jgi:hypothetical protein